MSNNKSEDLIIGRGRTDSTPWGRAVFCGLRALDPLLQRSLLLSAPLAGLAPYVGRSLAVPPPTGGSPIMTAGLGLTPFQTVIPILKSRRSTQRVCPLKSIQMSAGDLIKSPAFFRYFST